MEHTTVFHCIAMFVTFLVHFMYVGASLPHPLPHVLSLLSLCSSSSVFFINGLLNVIRGQSNRAVNFSKEFSIFDL